MQSLFFLGTRQPPSAKTFLGILDSFPLRTEVKTVSPHAVSARVLYSSTGNKLTQKVSIRQKTKTKQTKDKHLKLSIKITKTFLWGEINLQVNLEGWSSSKTLRKGKSQNPEARENL